MMYHLDGKRRLQSLVYFLLRRSEAELASLRR